MEPPASVLLKWRFPKTYRHPTLSSNITASRTIMEARALLRCAKAGVAVPAVRCVDEKEGILGLELIPGKSVREWLGGGAEGEDEQIIDSEEAAAADEEEVLSETDQIKLMRLIGKQLAVMHEADIIHGDLTTSNMMLRPASTDGTSHVDLDHDEVVLIDFGLSSVSAFAEDKAVDLYVLERAFASTHPASEGLYKTILKSYAEEVTARSSGKNRGKGGKLGKWEETRRKLEEGKSRSADDKLTNPDDITDISFPFFCTVHNFALYSAHARPKEIHGGVGEEVPLIFPFRDRPAGCPIKTPVGFRSTPPSPSPM